MFVWAASCLCYSSIMYTGYVDYPDRNTLFPGRLIVICEGDNYFVGGAMQQQQFHFFFARVAQNNGSKISHTSFRVRPKLARHDWQMKRFE